MKVIIDYLKANPKFTIVLSLSLIVCIIITVVLVLIRSKRRKIEIAEAEEQERQIQLEKTQQKMMNSIFDDLPKIVNNQEESPKTEESTANPEIDESNPEDEQVVTCVCDETIANNPPADIEEKSNYIEKLAKKSITTNKQNSSAPATSKEPSKSKNAQSENKHESMPETKPELKTEEVKYADLKASNGEIMLSSESYTSLSGIKSGIETLKKNIASENYAINLDKNGNYVFKIFSTANRLLCVGEGYSSKDQCEKAFASVKRFAKTAVIVNMIEKENAENK